MKIIITENKLRDTVKSMISELGTQTTIDFFGGWESFCQRLNINKPMDFLHLFDNLESIQDEKRPEITLYRYNNGENQIKYDKDSLDVYLSYDNIWSILGDYFNLNHTKTKELTQDWIEESYNLRGVITNLW